MEISDEMFHTWKKDHVTQAILRALNRLREEINEAMTDGTAIMDSNCQVRMVKLLGIREGIDLVLEVDCSQLSKDKVDEDTTDGI